jgi:hypothetical protein
MGKPCISQQVIEWVEDVEQDEEEEVAIHRSAGLVSSLDKPNNSVWALDDLQNTLRLTSQPLKELCHADGKRERFFDGLRLVWYPNQTVKEAYESGKQIIYFKNGDKKQVCY